MPSTRKIARLFAMEWSRIVQYRADTVLWTLAEAMVPLIALAIWYSVAQSASGGPTPRDVFTYYILVMFIKTITDSWSGVFLSQEILNGEIVQYLIRPLSVIWRHVANNLLEKAFKLLIPLPVLFVFIATFPDYFSPQIYQAQSIALFLVSILLAMAVAFTTDLLLGTVTFWLEDSFEVRRFYFMFEQIASGVLIPFAFLPPLVHTIFSWLPFRYVISVPAEIILGQAQGSAALTLLAIQTAWIIAASIGLRFLWVRGLKRYAVPGQ